jgi:hypothetical protein
LKALYNKRIILCRKTWVSYREFLKLRKEI